jgi:hypothetical protein
MDPNTVRVLEQLQTPDLSLSKTLQCSEDILSELKRVLMAHIEHRLGKRLKSAKYLNPVGYQ